ncbi:MAG: hypothetical protein AB8B96_22430 [Lysobacterales bacterium]
MFRPLFICAALVLAVVSSADSAPLEPVFSIQGELREGSAPANGNYDIEASLFNVATGGVSIDVTTVADTVVSDGLFVIELDYTSAPFEIDEQYWVEIAVRPSGSGQFVPLTPRTKLTAAPYALGAVSVLPGAIGAEEINAAQVQARVSGNCPVGQSIRSIGEDGSVTCQVDSGTTYTGADFALSNQNCGVGQVVTAINASGNVVCANDQDTTYSGSDFATSNQTCPAGQVIREIDASGNALCAVDVDTTYSGANFALSNQTCQVGTNITGVNSLGQAICSQSPGIDVVPRRNYAFEVYDQGSDTIGQGLAMVIGADGFPIISHVDTSNGDLLVTHCQDTICVSSTTSIVDPAVGSGPAYTSIAISADGLPIIGYYDSDDASLKFALCNDIGCTGSNETINTVDSGNDVGQYVSLGIGFQDDPVLAYYDATAMDLKWVRCTSSSCANIDRMDVVDSVGDVGSHVSMAMRGSLSLISYYDASNEDLKFVRCSSRDCVSPTQTVVSDGIVGLETSIFLNQSRPIIVFLDDREDTFIAACTDTTCTAATVSQTTGLFSDAPPIGTMTSNGLPLIVHARTGLTQAWICDDADCTSGSRETLPDTRPGGNNDIAIAIDLLGYPIIVTGLGSEGIALVRCGSRNCKEP